MAERRDSESLLSSTGSDSEQISLTPAEGTTSLPDIRSVAGNRKVQDMLLVLNQDNNTGELSKEAIELLRDTPDNYIPVAHQIGGHKYINGKPGFIQKKGEPQYILKPLKLYPKGSRELKFYEFFKGKDLTEDVKELKKFIPKYYGVRTLPQTTGGSDPKPNYMCLEDCIYPFKKSSILDLKLGKREFENVVDKAKLLRAKNKYPVQDVIGFRIQGMRIYKVESDNFKYYDRAYGLSLLDDKQVQEGLLNFLDNRTQVRYDILPSIIEKISEIRDWFANQTTYKLFASSILLIYEGSQSPGVDSSRVDCRIIDFAHAFFSSELDDPGADSLYGADRVLHHLKQIQEMQ